MQSKISRGQRIRDEFFTRADSDSRKWICVKCKTVRVQKGTGYSNLTSHVESAHRQLLNGFLQSSEHDRESKIPDSIFFTPKTVQIYSWIDSVINGLLPFTIFEKPVGQPAVKYKPITQKTLMKYIHLLTELVEEIIQKKLPSKFALIHDGWTANQTHYVGMFATFPSSNEIGYERILLGFSSFESEDSMSADAHIEYITFVLELFNRSISNVVGIVGDNFSVNLSISRKLETGFIGCASHRFNLAVKNLFKEDDGSSAKVHAIVKSLRKLILAAKLRKHSHLSPICYTPTRWSIAAMLQRYLQLKPALSELDLDDHDVRLLSNREDKRFEVICKKYSQLDTVTKALQSDKISCADVRAIFYSVVEEYPNTESPLASNLQIVHNPEFESGFLSCKTQTAASLTPSELLAVKKLKITTGIESTEAGSGIPSLAERGLKKRRLNALTRCQYMDTRFLLPTSNLCEHLFSVAGYALGERRGRILPSKFEEQIFLHMNNPLWGIEDFSRIVGNDVESANIE